MGQHGTGDRGQGTGALPLAHSDRGLVDRPYLLGPDGPPRLAGAAIGPARTAGGASRGVEQARGGVRAQPVSLIPGRAGTAAGRKDRNGSRKAPEKHRNGAGTGADSGGPCSPFFIPGPGSSLSPYQSGEGGYEREACPRVETHGGPVGREFSARIIAASQPEWVHLRQRPLSPSPPSKHNASVPVAPRRHRSPPPPAGGGEAPALVVGAGSLPIRAPAAACRHAPDGNGRTL